MVSEQKEKVKKCEALLYSWANTQPCLWVKIFHIFEAALAPNGAVGHHEQAVGPKAAETAPLPTPTLGRDTGRGLGPVGMPESLKVVVACDHWLNDIDLFLKKEEKYEERFA